MERGQAEVRRIMKKYRNMTGGLFDGEPLKYVGPARHPRREGVVELLSRAPTLSDAAWVILAKEVDCDPEEAKATGTAVFDECVARTPRENGDLVREIFIGELRRVVARRWPHL